MWIIWKGTPSDEQKNQSKKFAVKVEENVHSKKERTETGQYNHVKKFETV